MLFSAACLLTQTVRAAVMNFDVPGSVSGFTNYSGQGAYPDAGNNVWNPIVANGTTGAGSYSNGTASPITLTVADDTVYAGGGQGANGTPAGLDGPFATATTGAKTGTLNNVPAGTYSLYLYGSNGGFYDRGTTFTVGTTSASTVNSTAGSTAFIQWDNYVVIPNIVVGTGGGAITFTYQANSSVEYHGTAPNTEGDFNGLQLVATPALANTIVPSLSVWTAHNDNNRSGANLNEASLTPANVNSTNFGLLFTDAVDGDMYGQPLYVRGITLGGNIVNAVFCSTANNSLYCFDADTAGTTYWSRNLGVAIPQGNVQCCCKDIQTVIGIISTGVIDLNTQTWYVVTQEYNSVANTYAAHLHAIDLYSGNEKFGGPVAIAATSGTLALDPKLNNQRAGLLLQNGTVYIGFSSHNDCGAYHGWLLGYNASTLAQTSVYVDTPTGSQGGIWQAGGGLVGDGVNEYLMTGNGTFDLNTGGSNAAMSFLRMQNGARQDSFTMAAETTYNNADRDLGGGAVLWIPGTRVLVGGGKDGHFYVVGMDNMGGFNASVDACLDSFMVTSTSQSLNHLHGPPTYFNGMVYTGGESDYLKGYAWSGSSFPHTPTTQSTFTDVLGSMPGFQTSASGNGAQNGVIWAARVNSGNANNAVQPGIMHAFQAGALGTELYNTLQNSTRDNYGNFAKNPAPVCANGKVYLPTFSNKLAVYGPLTNYRSGTSSLMASWRLNDGAGTSAADSTGNNNTGAVTGTASWGAGPTGNFTAFNFNGSSYIACGDSQSLNTTEAISVTGWFKTTMAATGGGSILRHDGHYTALQLTATGQAQTALWNNGTLNKVMFNWTYNDGNWHHYASTYDMTQGVNIYVDGTLVASNTTLRGPLSTATVAGGSVTSPTPFMLGAREGGSEFYTGSLSQVGVWGRALSQAEISALAAKGASGNVGGTYTEAEQAQIVQHTSGIPIVISDATGFSSNSGSVLQATATGNQIAYLVQNLSAKSYTVKVGVQKRSDAGQIQVAIGASGSTTPTNQGTVQDLYSASTSYAVLTINTAWAPGSSSDKWVWFTTTGKNASSSGYKVAIDYISITPN